VTGGDVVLHEDLECLNDAMNCPRRLKSEAVGELFVRGAVPSLGLIYEGVAEMLSTCSSNHAPPSDRLEPAEEL
jgi:hypothetical protein